jgi:hypothetical protein
VKDPIGGNLYPQDNLIGRTVFYFPLTGGSLASWPWRTRTGRLFEASPPAGIPLAVTSPQTEAGGGGASWESDERFGSALTCDGGAPSGFQLEMRRRDTWMKGLTCKRPAALYSATNHIDRIGTRISIPSIPYGRTGAFAIALWFKRSSGQREKQNFEYLFSHSNAKGTDPAFRHNQVIAVMSRLLVS